VPSRDGPLIASRPSLRPKRWPAVRRICSSPYPSPLPCPYRDSSRQMERRRTRIVRSRTSRRAIRSIPLVSIRSHPCRASQLCTLRHYRPRSGTYHPWHTELNSLVPPRRDLKGMVARHPSQSASCRRPSRELDASFPMSHRPDRLARLHRGSPPPRFPMRRSERQRPSEPRGRRSPRARRTTTSTARR